MVSDRVLLALVALVSAVNALQKPERHYGCPPGKNVCIYPIDDAVLQCETIMDFQVALHVRINRTIKGIRKKINIKLTLPSGDVVTPESLFGVKSELRSWKLGVLDSIVDRTPVVFTSYALIFRNVIIPRSVGKGAININVTARGVNTEVSWSIRPPTKRRAKNVILVVGDGMALPMMAAARLVSRGMVHGKYQDKLFMEKMPYQALQNPSGVDSIITDSANAASAFNSGHKSTSQALGIYADSKEDLIGHPKVETIAEYVKRRFGMSVGVVTTSEVQDATPAAVWGHIRNRSAKAAVLSQALNGCGDCVLAVQPDVLMGGGGKYFLPEDSIDGSNLYKNFSDAGYTITHTRSEMLAAAKSHKTKKLLTISHREDMEVWLDRNVYTDNKNISENSPTGDGVPPIDQPDLDEMAMSAIEILSRNENGFYLMIEAASIDKAAHVQDVPRLLSDLIELDNTVGKVMKWAKKHGDDTLIIATADHAHGFDVFGTVDTAVWDALVPASDENPVSDVEHMCKPVTDFFGRVFSVKREKTTKMRVREANRARRFAIGPYGFAGYPDYEDRNGDHFPDSWNVRTVLAAGMNNYPDHTEDYKVSTSFRQPAVNTEFGYLNNPNSSPNGIFLTGNLNPLIPSAVHTLQDVGAFGYGPGAEKLRGNIDNTEIFHIIASSLGFGTNGTIDTDSHIFDDLVKCKNADGFCHCGHVRGKYKCSCRRNGPESFVRPATPICRIQNGSATPVK